MNKFKVGDKVRRIIDSHMDVGVGDIVTIESIPEYDILKLYGHIGTYMIEKFETVEKEKPLIGDYSPSSSCLCLEGVTTATETVLSCSGTNYYQIKQKETIMNKIEKYVKNLTLSADEKLLRKHGLHDECGNTTDTGMDAIENMIYSKPENQAYLLEIAKGLEAEESKK